MAETKYGGTVTNVKRKRVPGGGGSSYSKTTRAKACVRTRGTANKLYSLMNEVYETERIVSIRSEDRQDEQ